MNDSTASGRLTPRQSNNNNNIRRDDWQTLTPTVGGWGINDVNYRVQIKEQTKDLSGKCGQKLLWICPYYQDWRNLIYRCFNAIALKKRPNYSGCTICEEWKYLSNFIEWVDSQPNKNWQNCQLDKDLLYIGNKHYSPETCVYISSQVNIFATDRCRYRGKYMIGVTYFNSVTELYISQCNSPFTKKKTHLGVYVTELEAHKAWQAKKHEYACQLADMQEDERVAKALRERYAPDKDWTNK